MSFTCLINSRKTRISEFLIVEISTIRWACEEPGVRVEIIHRSIFTCCAAVVHGVLAVSTRTALLKSDTPTQHVLLRLSEIFPLDICKSG